MKLNEYVEVFGGRTGWVCEIESGRRLRVKVRWETGGVSGWIDVEMVKRSAKNWH
jgi:hypothetical protein